MKKAYRTNLTGDHDLQEHLGLLHGLAMGCDTVVELGMRHGMSTSAFLGAGCKVVSVDIAECRGAKRRFETDYPETFTFIQEDSREVEIPSCDMLFIDTRHDYALLKVELHLHGAKAKKWIVMHDTEEFGDSGCTEGDPGLKKAIAEFLSVWWDFSMHLHLPNCCGLTLLKRQGA